MVIECVCVCGCWIKIESDTTLFRCPYCDLLLEAYWIHGEDDNES